jgi:glutathione S-transferase
MKFYSSPLSPYARKVSVLLHETKLFENVEIIMAPTPGTPLNPGDYSINHNPLGKIPVLIQNDGFAIYDSRVICRYLDELARSNLYSQGSDHWRMMVLEATGEGVIDAALLMSYEWRIRPEEFRFPEWVEGQWSKISRTLETIEDRWMEELYGKLNMGQIVLGCALGYLDFRNSDRNWRDQNPLLANWFKSFSERESMVKTAPG